MVANTGYNISKLCPLYRSDKVAYPIMDEFGPGMLVDGPSNHSSRNASNEPYGAFDWLDKVSSAAW